MQTDASDIGIGAILIQENRIVGIYSKELSGSELNYTTPEKEIYEIIKALDHFKNIIWCSKILIETDSKNVSYLNCNQTSRARRWQILLNMYNIILKHISGSNNVWADFLSRNHRINEIDNSNLMRDVLELIKATEVSKEKVKAKNLIQNPVKKIYVTQDSKVYIPEGISKRFLKQLHEKLLHSGVSRLYNSIKLFY